MGSQGCSAPFLLLRGASDLEYRLGLCSTDSLLAGSCSS